MDLAGRWRKVSSTECAAPYPQLLELEAGGRYTGTNEAPSVHHPIWDRGGWEQAGPGRLRISLANDARREYQVSLAGDTLTFVDDEGCRIEYTRG
jgi:hypothetical protein